jgi:hypothetical protein
MKTSNNTGTGDEEAARPQSSVSPSMTRQEASEAPEGCGARKEETEEEKEKEETEEDDELKKNSSSETATETPKCSGENSA